MNVACDGDSAVAIGGSQRTQSTEREQPLRQVVEVLSIPVGRLADPDAARSAEYPADLSDEPLRLIQIALLAQMPVQGNEKHHPKCVRPQVAAPVWPDPRA